MDFNRILEKYYINDGLLPGHLDSTIVSGVEISAGSLGHGLSVGMGMALAGKILNQNYKIVVLLSDLNMFPYYYTLLNHLKLTFHLLTNQ